MKIKVKTLYMGIFVGLLFVILGLVSLCPDINARAASQTDIAVNESFDTSTLSDEWLHNDFSHTVGEYSMRFQGPYQDFMSIVSFNYFIDGDAEISFDIARRTIEDETFGSGWIGLGFGNGDIKNRFGDCYAALICSDQSVQLMENIDENGNITNMLTDYSLTKNHQYTESSFVDAAKKNTITVTITLTKTGTREVDGRDLYTLEMYHYLQGGERPAEPQVVYENVAAGGYFGFNSMSNMIFDIMNFKILKDGKIVAEDNFHDSENTGIFYGRSSSDLNFRAVNLPKNIIYTRVGGAINTAEKSNGILLSRTCIEADPKVYKPFELAFSAAILDLPEKSAVGVGFSLSENSITVDEVNFVGMQGVGNNKFRFVTLLNGEIVDFSPEYPLSALSDINTLCFIGSYDGSVTVSIGIFEHVFKNIKFAGNFAIGTSGTKNCEVVVDDISLRVDSVISSDAESMSINFTGLKEADFDGTKLYSKYVNTAKWFIGDKINIPQYSSYTERNYIQFTDSNEESSFGAKARYSDFIARFSITVTENRDDIADETWIGLSFAKTSLYEDALSSPGIFFGKTASGMVIKGNHLESEQVESDGYIHQYKDYPQLDFYSSTDWESAPVTYQIMIVACNGKIYVYYADKSSAPEEMEVCRAEFNATEAEYGFVTVSAYNGATFRLNEYSITNLEGNSDFDFQSEESYTKKNTVAINQPNTVLGNDSSFITANSFKNFILMCDITQIKGNSVRIDFGSDNYLVFNADNNIVSNMNLLEKGRDFRFLDISEGGRLMIMAVGDTVRIGVANKNEPQELLYEYVATYKLQNNLKSDKIAISTDNYTVAEISDIEIFSMNYNIDYVTENFDPANETHPVKPAPPDSDGVETDNLGTILIVVFSCVGGIIVIGVGILFIVRINKQRKKTTETEEETNDEEK